MILFSFFVPSVLLPVFPARTSGPFALPERHALIVAMLGGRGEDGVGAGEEPACVGEPGFKGDLFGE